MGEGPGPDLGALMRDLCRELGARDLAWLPRGPSPMPGSDRAHAAGRTGGASSGRGDTRAVDWGLVADLAPGQVHSVGEQDRRRSPRLAAGEGREFYVATAQGVRPAGVLRLLSDRTLPLGRRALVALADLLAGLCATREQGAAARTARRERDIGRRVASLSHDLRNQLTLAILQVERVRDRSDSVAGLLDGLDVLENVLCAARDLCSGTLADEPPAPKKRLVLRSILIEEARAAAALSRNGRQVSLAVRCPTDLRLLADLPTLARLVRNLLLNAVKASVDGGAVRIEARPTQDGSLELVVEDQGRGMSAELVERLFHAGVSGAGGTGYGTVSLVECLKGLDATCRVETAPGAGTRVTVQMAGAPPEDRPAVLLLDPDPVRRSARASRLYSAGYGVWQAASAGEALVLVRSTSMRALLIARGTAGAGLAELTDHCAREGVRTTTLAAGADPVVTLERGLALTTLP